MVMTLVGAVNSTFSLYEKQLGLAGSKNLTKNLIMQTCFLFAMFRLIDFVSQCASKFWQSTPKILRDFAENLVYASSENSCLLGK